MRNLSIVRNKRIYRNLLPSVPVKFIFVDFIPYTMATIIDLTTDTLISTTASPSSRGNDGNHKPADTKSHYQGDDADILNLLMERESTWLDSYLMAANLTLNTAQVLKAPQLHCAVSREIRSGERVELCKRGKSHIVF